jgi:transposase
LSGGHVADIKGAASLLSATAPSGRMIGDKGYDATHLRLFLESRGTTPVIPNKANRKTLFPFDAELYRLRNIIERTFFRIKDFRGIGPAMTSSPATSSLPSASLPPSASGSIESTP